MLTDYMHYRFSGWEWGKEFLKGCGMSAGILYLFYRNILLSLLLGIPAALFYIRIRRRERVKERKWELNLEFREGINSLSAALHAGYSIENSFGEAVKDLQLLYGESSMILKEFQYIDKQLSLNRTVESLLMDFAKRSGEEDIHSFAQVFVTAKRTGGDIMDVIRSTAHTISDKIEIKRDIQTMITAKKLEANIMNLIPLGMILYMWVGSPGFLNPMYESAIGRVTMTLALGGYIGSYYLSQRIVDIEV